MAHARGLGDNAGMADDERKFLLWGLLRFLDGNRASTTLGWVNLVVPVVNQAAAGAGHRAAGRPQRALAEWAGAAGFGLVAWGLGTEAPTAAEVQEDLRRQLDLMRKPGTPAPAPTGPETPAARRISRFFRRWGLVSPVVSVVITAPWRLRHPRRLTVGAIAGEAWLAVFHALRVPRAVRRRRPRTAVGSALVVAGSVARLRAASAEPLQ